MEHGGATHQADDGGSLVSFGDALLYGGLTFSKDISGGFSGVWGLSWSGKRTNGKLRIGMFSQQKKGGGLQQCCAPECLCLWQLVCFFQLSSVESMTPGRFTY